MLQVLYMLHKLYNHCLTARVNKDVACVEHALYTLYSFLLSLEYKYSVHDLSRAVDKQQG